MMPGFTAFTRIPCGMSFFASDLVNAPNGGLRGGIRHPLGLPPLRAATKATLTMTPDFRAIVSRGHGPRHTEDTSKIYVRELPPEPVGYFNQRRAAN